MNKANLSIANQSIIPSLSGNLVSSAILGYHLPSADVKESANPDGRVGILVWVFSPLPRNDEEELSIPLMPSSACHFFTACGNVMSKSIAYISSVSRSDGFQSSVRDESTFTAWPMSGLWEGSRAQQ